MDTAPIGRDDLTPSVDGGSLLPRLSVGFCVGAVDRRTEPLQRQVELIVCGVQVIDDALKGRRILDVVTDGKEQPMRNVDENGHLIEVLGGYRRFHMARPLNGHQQRTPDPGPAGAIGGDGLPDRASGSNIES